MSLYETKGHISKEIISADFIFSVISSYDIFRFYIPSLKRPNVKFCSELRKDNHPSCSVTRFSDIFLYKDFATGDSYSCIGYVQAKYSVDFKGALYRIACDFNLLNQDLSALKPNVGLKRTVEKEVTVKVKSPYNLGITSIPFTKAGLKYWRKYGITKDILKMYNVKQISHYTSNGFQRSISTKELAFAYCFGNYKYKILRPNASKADKWRCNTNANTIQGINQLPLYGKLLIITKSLKDVMLLRKLGYFAIAPSSENTIPDKYIISSLKDRWQTILIYYDNDLPGLNSAKEFSSLHNILYFYHPVEVMEKDLSDYYEKHGRKKTVVFLQTLLSNVTTKADVYSRECTFFKE